MVREISMLERARLAYRPRMPELLRRGLGLVGLVEGPVTTAVRDAERIRERFPGTYGRPILRLADGNGPDRQGPLRIGVVLSGGQAPGGHNVIAGLFDALGAVHGESKLFGFLGGPRGIFCTSGS